MTAMLRPAANHRARLRLWGAFGIIGLLLAWPHLASSRASGAQGGMPAPHGHLVPDTDEARLAQLEPVVRLAPRGAQRAVVLLLSDRAGWTPAMQRDAMALRDAGMAVLGVSAPRLLQQLTTGPDVCISPNLSLSLLAKDFEHRLGLAVYVRPIIAGRGLGGNIVFASLAQGSSIFRGGVSLGFDARLPTSKAWCATRRPIATRSAEEGGGWRLQSGQRFTAPWIVAASNDGERMLARHYLAMLPYGQLQREARPSILSVLQPLAGTPKLGGGGTDAAWISALPISTVTDPAARSRRLMAVFYSGDGGWAGFDRDTASALAKSGVPVVGIDSLSYFWSARKPAEAAADLARVIDRFQRRWGQRRVILVGYSFGADNLPFIAGALPQRLRPWIARISLLGLSERTDFQFHLESWLDMTRSDAMLTVPAIARIHDMPVQCIRGVAELDSACNAIPKGGSLVSVIPGGHHFKRDYPRIARTILNGLVI